MEKNKSGFRLAKPTLSVVVEVETATWVDALVEAEFYGSRSHLLKRALKEFRSNHPEYEQVAKDQMVKAEVGVEA